MRQKWIYTAALLVVGAIGLQAQEYIEPADTVTIRPKPLTVIGTPATFSILQPYFYLQLPDEGETREQRAARINRETYQRVLTSVDQNLYWNKPPHLSNTAKVLLFIGGLFLSGPYRFQPGTVPLMNTSNPFIYARTPGMAPYEYPYSPDAFPQCIRMEYDFKSGTYQQVMVKWEEVERSMARSFGGPYRNDPVPRMKFSSDRFVY